MCTRWVVRVVSVACMAMLCAAITPAVAENESTVRETGRLLAVLLDVGRVVIGHNQLLLNDPTKGNKGFTPEVFSQQTIAAFKDRTGHDLANLSASTVPEVAKPLMGRLLEESKKTVASYQTVINMPGIKYKGLIPATFGTETGARFQSWSGVYMKQTAPDNLVRNPKNKPDAFESAEMKKMSEPSFSRMDGQVVSAMVEDGKTVRVLLPLFYGKDCLICHGMPKGEPDVTGYPREGAQEGDLGGVISVKLPMP
jgi:hypothetical protein